MILRILFFFVLIVVLIACGENTHNNQTYALLGPKETVRIQDTTLQKSMERGAEIYVDFCMQCHLVDGKGVAGTFPPLANADFLLKNIDKSIYAVKFGLNGEIIVNGKSYNSAMPDPGLYDDEIADVMNYILNSWGNAHKIPITEEQVTAIEQ